MNSTRHLRPAKASPSLLLKSIALIACSTALPSFAATCTELQSEVEAKIHNAGVSQFTISIADANAPTSGKVVGTCEMGAKKLIYTLAPSSNNVAFAPPVPPKPKTEAILTECRDGSVSMGGDCK
jgi:hypothetical protein